MSALTHPPLTTQPIQRLQRFGAVAAVIAAALVLWAVATQAAGVDLRSPAFSTTQHPAAVGAGLVAVAAALAALAAWALLAILERTIRHPRRAWTTIAMVAVVISLGAPLSGHGITGTDRAVLACLHLVVATTVIVLLGRTAGHTSSANRQDDDLEVVTR
jgi:hypothetical protein